ncbi:hypothetical protein [Brevirhabdus sp.]|uniref:hypothetical protein n=1 Tax=Brevirhabdus sp. TaxID=2004514 RepID=UPI0040596C0F
MTLLSALFAAAFALTHIFIGKLRFLERTPRSRWLSASGGVAVSYIFLHVLPELAAHRDTFAEALGLGAGRAETAVYALALAGLITFYGLERSLKRSIAPRPATPPRSGETTEAAALPPVGAFWLHIGSFALYNAIIGYLLLHRETPGLWSLVIYGVAMVLHFVTNDFGLREHHRRRYDQLARWILAGAVLAGWALGLVGELPPIGIGLLFAFLAGGVVLNVLKEELPEDRQSSFLPFLLGAAGYSVLLAL